MKKTLPYSIGVLVLLTCVIGFFLYTFTKNAPQVVATSATYVCKDNKIIGAKFYTEVPSLPVKQKAGEMPNPTGSVDLTLSDGRSMHLLQTISASGARYATTDESFVFWSKGKGALVLEQGKERNYIDCEEGLRKAHVASTTQKFMYDSREFSVIMPRYTIPPALQRTDSYTVDTNHTYGLIPGEIITGTKFTVPSGLTNKTNLSRDSYISVEHIDAVKTCLGSMFLEGTTTSINTTENGVTYSRAQTNGAAAGNRYDETVYAIKKNTTCFAVRYFIHYSVFENYPPGTIQEFDKQKLIKSFDAIRTTLVIHI